MPKDHYSLARARDRKSAYLQNPYTTPRKSYWDKHNILNTKCWFGKYKGMKFIDMPLDYLEWLVSDTTRNPEFIVKLRGLLDDVRKSPLPDK